MPSDRRNIGPPRGVLSGVGREETNLNGEHTRHAPPTSLAPYIAHFWWVHWELAEAQIVETVPHPTVHLLYESPSYVATSSGISLRRFTRTLEGTGTVFGIKLRPAIFSLFSETSLVEHRERPLALQEALPKNDFLKACLSLGRDVARAVSGEDATRMAEEQLLKLQFPPLSDTVVAMRDLVEKIEKDRSLVRVSDLAALTNIEVRTLERQFRTLVGLSPKSVLARYRLIEAAEQLKLEPEPSLAKLASELGYVDQAHFSRDFRNFVGMTPRELRKLSAAKASRR